MALSNIPHSLCPSIRHRDSRRGRFVRLSYFGRFQRGPAEQPAGQAHYRVGHNCLRDNLVSERARGYSRSIHLRPHTGRYIKHDRARAGDIAAPGMPVYWKSCRQGGNIRHSRTTLGLTTPTAVAGFRLFPPRPYSMLGVKRRYMCSRVLKPPVCRAAARCGAVSACEVPR